MCARWEDGWRPNFGKPCDETFPIEKWCSNEKMKEIQKCLGLPAHRRTGIFDDLTMSKLREKEYHLKNLKISLKMNTRKYVTNIPQETNYHQTNFSNRKL